MARQAHPWFRRSDGWWYVRVSGRQQKLAREFYPTFSETDLVNLPNHSIYLKLLIDGKPPRAFSAVTLAPRDRDQSYKHEILDLSRQNCARPRQEVERAVSPWMSHPAGASDQRRLI